MFFINWYLQVLGAVLGIIVYMYAYLSGKLPVIGSTPTSDVNTINIVISYTLYPMCILLILFSVLAYILKKTHRLTVTFVNINKVISHLTVILGLVGCAYYFIIPSIFILYKDIIPVVFEAEIRRRNRNYFKLNISNMNNTFFQVDSYNNLIVLFDFDKDEFIIKKIFIDEELFTLSYNEAISLLDKELSEDFIKNALRISNKELELIRNSIKKVEAEVC